MTATRPAQYPMITLPKNHGLRKYGSAKTVSLGRKVLYDKLGDGPHPCHWCGKALNWGDPYETKLYADHVNWDVEDNAPDNLVPACVGCNAARRRPDGLRSITRVSSRTVLIRVPVYDKECLHCGKAFQSRNAAARYCCEKHRAAMWYKRHKSTHTHICPDCGAKHRYPERKVNSRTTR